MHETVFARRIIEEAQKHGDVKSINLEIGELAHVPSNELVDCLRDLINWNVNYTIKSSKIKCKCGFIGHPKILDRGHDYFFIECPKCGDIPELIEGQDIKIVSVMLK